jgi:hypothetical protein
VELLVVVAAVAKSDLPLSTYLIPRLAIWESAMNNSDQPQIEFLTNLSSVQSPTASVLPGLGVRPRLSTSLTSNQVEERVRDAVEYMSRYLESLARQSANEVFELAEAEFTLLVTESGKINIVVADPS